MDKDRVAGRAKRAKGSVKDAVGKVTGNRKTRGQGTIEKTEGGAQKSLGGIKDALRDATGSRKSR